MKIVCISDTHCQLDKIVDDLPDGDVLVHAGDLTYRGTLPEVSRELSILGSLTKKYKHILMVAGNHDFLFEKHPQVARSICMENGILYMQDSSFMIDGINFWGSPYQPWFYDWAFNKRRGLDLERVWAQIPDNTNVLITHGPPRFHLETCPDGSEVGCLDLHNRIQYLPVLRLHVFGHIHLSYGMEESISGIKYVNASICTEEYKPTNLPIVVEI